MQERRLRRLGMVGRLGICLDGMVSEELVVTQKPTAEEERALPRLRV